MIEVRKNDNESIASLIRRFGRRVQEAGILARARHLRFNARPKSDIKKKKEAMKKVLTKKKLDYLRKLGKIE